MTAQEEQEVEGVRRDGGLPGRRPLLNVLERKGSVGPETSIIYKSF